MGPVTLPQAEVGGKVALEVVLLLDGLKNGLVDGLLVLGAAGGNLLLLGLLALLEESLLGALLVGLLVAGEVVRVGDLLEGLAVEAVDGDGGAGGDHVASVDAAEGNAVDLERTGDQEDTLVEGLEEHNALATEAASEKDEDGTGLEGSTGLVRVLGLAGLWLYVQHLRASSNPQFHVPRSHSLQSISRPQVLPYLLHDLLVLSRVVLQGLVGRRGDDPLALLELLGLRLGRHFGGAGRPTVRIVSICGVVCVFGRRGCTDVFRMVTVVVSSAVAAVFVMLVLRILLQ